MRKFFFVGLLAVAGLAAKAQVQWTLVDSLYGPLPQGFHVYRTQEPLEGKPNIAYCVVASLREKGLQFLADTTLGRRLTPLGFYEKNQHPLLVVNTSFFSFTTHQNLNVVIHDKKILAYNIHSIAGKGRDTLTWKHPLVGAIGIDARRRADVAWLYTDSAAAHPMALQSAYPALKDSSSRFDERSLATLLAPYKEKPRPWKMVTAVGGGPVLLQDKKVKISNNEELKFAGKAIDDKHPRTAIGYTDNNEVVILVAEGRFPGRADGLTLAQTAQLLQQWGCVEALNLDGGGSSCMLINGKETVRPSDKEGQRAVPGVFMIKAHR